MSTTKRLCLITAVLVSLGLLFVFEASVAEAFAMVGDPYYFLKQQAIRAVVGLVVLLIAAKIPTTWWAKLGPWAYVGSMVALVAVFIPGIGLELNGAHRWISIAGFVIQPVEFMKLAIAIFFAKWLTTHQRLGPWLVLTGLPAALILAQPDMGSLLVVIALCFSLFFVAGGSMKSVLSVMGVGVLLLAVAVLVSPYRLRRVTTFLNPESDPLGASFHIRQITLALGNGHWIGQGLGNSRQKYSYIPEASTDSIFAIIAEEIGFLGSLVLLSLFGLYIGTALQIIKQQPPGSYEQFLAIGLTLWLTFQILLNLSAVVALVPLTGVPLPFFSYGGSSLVMVLLATGVLLRLSRNAGQT